MTNFCMYPVFFSQNLLKHKNNVMKLHNCMISTAKSYPGEKSQNAPAHIDVTQTRIISLLSALWGNNEVPADFHAK